jgi:DNA-binding XRE family transcriptional regulator
MLVRVKTPHIKISIDGDVPAKIIKLLKNEYGDKVTIDDDEEYLVVRDSQWYKNISGKMTPGDHMRIYRENLGWTQEKLGIKLGGVPRQHISNMEKGRRTISIETAKQLSKIFKKPVSRFL